MVPDLRPRGIGEILDAAVRLYRARFGQLVRCAVLVVVPLEVLLALVQLSAQPDGYTVAVNGAASPRFDSASVQLAATAVVLIIGTLTHAFIVAVSTRIVADAYVGREEGTGRLLRLTGRRFVGVIGVGLLVGLSEIVGAMFCGVGIVVPMTLFAVAVPSLILERKRVFAALGRSVELTRSHFWHVLGLVVTASLIGSLLNAGLAAGLNLWITRAGSATTIVLAQTVTNAIASVLTVPFVATATVVLYFDLRIRNEAFDVQMALTRTLVPAA